ncbi:hypothetical protein Droror1_Dr00009756 [Drosera rotundifolia]
MKSKNHSLPRDEFEDLQHQQLPFTQAVCYEPRHYKQLLKTSLKLPNFLPVNDLGHKRSQPSSDTNKPQDTNKSLKSAAPQVTNNTELNPSPASLRENTHNNQLHSPSSLDFPQSQQYSLHSLNELGLSDELRGKIIEDLDFWMTRKKRNASIDEIIQLH